MALTLAEANRIIQAAMTKAQEKYESVKKMVEELKSVGPDKWESLKDGLTKAFDELKKLVGL